jgi:hypothetical protein
MAEAADKYAKKKREPNAREKRRIAEKLRKAVRRRRNARHG